MKKILPLIIVALLSFPLSAQDVTTPLSPRRGGGGEAAGGGAVYTLQQLKDSARANNINVRSARLAVRQAGEQRREAFTAYFPQVSGTGGWFNANRPTARMEMNPSELIPASLQGALAQSLPAEALAALGSPLGLEMMKNGTIAGITAVQPVFAGGQILNANRLARIGEDASREQLRLAEQDVELQTEEYYWQLVSLGEKQRTLAAARQTLDTIRRDVALAVEAGLALRNDLLQVELRQNELASQQLQLDNGESIVKMLLAQYCSLTPSPSPRGEGSGYNFRVVIPEEYNSNENSEGNDYTQQDISRPSPLGEGSGVRLSGVRLLGVESLPEYRLLSLNLRAAELEHKLELGRHLPSVAVGAGLNYHNLLGPNRTFGMVFATVSVPLSGWWGGSHALRRKRLAVVQAREQLDDNAQLLAIRQQKAWNDVQEARAQLRLAEQAIDQAAENLRVQRDQYAAGTLTIADLLQAQLLHQQTLDRRTEARAALALRRLALRHACGE